MGMTMTAVEAFEMYRRLIWANEEYLKDYGTFENPYGGDPSNLELEKAYHQVQPFLTSISHNRMFNAPGCSFPFSAQNYHEALMLILNSPEYWFGQLWVLNCQEYLALKDGCIHEEKWVFSQELSMSAKPEIFVMDARPLSEDQSRLGRPQKRKSCSRSTVIDGELLSFDGMILLNWLLSYHGCISGKPHNTEAPNQKWIARQLTAQGNEFTQTRVSRTLDEIMAKAPKKTWVRKQGSNSKVLGKQMYTRLCEAGTICEVLNGIQLSSNEYLDRQVRELAKEFQVENVEGYAESGYT